MKIKESIKKKKARLRSARKFRAFGKEIEGLFKDNINFDRVTPKTIKKSGRTLIGVTGTGIKSIKTIIENGIFKTGNTQEYMGYHLTGIKKTNLPKRNWLMKPEDLDERVQIFIRSIVNG